MSLQPDEIARRIRAARELRRLNQEDLAKLVAADGLGSSDVGRIERMEMSFTRVHRDALCRHLQVPERWFTEDDVDVIVGTKLSDEAVAQLLQPALLAAVRDLRRAEGLEPLDENEPGRP